ncbi:hypothetical protein [Propionimicrobium lymphophilum]|uniref:hypothetical protein n=1 Tax=Propionimicrobium lymphophilum TaxID=33012 RepID=UPI00040E98ED|nr:hypothetical protein [Propionimicrobium lymphophilum]
MSFENVEEDDDLFPVQGPKITSPGLHKCSITEAARAYAENSGWYFDMNDVLYDHNKKKLCDSIEELAEILLSNDCISISKDGYFPNWTPLPFPDSRAKVVRSTLRQR